MHTPGLEQRGDDGNPERSMDAPALLPHFIPAGILPPHVSAGLWAGTSLSPAEWRRGAEPGLPDPSHTAPRSTCCTAAIRGSHRRGPSWCAEHACWGQRPLRHLRCCCRGERRLLLAPPPARAVTVLTPPLFLLESLTGELTARTRGLISWQRYSVPGPAPRTLPKAATWHLSIAFCSRG